RARISVTVLPTNSRPHRCSTPAFSKEEFRNVHSLAALADERAVARGEAEAGADLLPPVAVPPAGHRGVRRECRRHFSAVPPSLSP
ncbi:MAG: hypothetical protein ACRDP6_48485, partial [Actinoallomurus sp.]